MCMHVHTGMLKHLHARVHMHLCLLQGHMCLNVLCMHASMCICKCVFDSQYMRTHVHMHMRMQMQLCVWVCQIVCVCDCV